MTSFTQICEMLVSILVRALRDPVYQKEIKRMERRREKSENSVQAILRDKAYSAPLEDENADLYSLEYFRNFIKLQTEVSKS